MPAYSALFDRLGIRLPDVLLPRPGTDLAKWAVVACDQYSSEREYWKRAADTVGQAPSTLNLIFPEAFLEDEDKAERVGRIQAAMRDYLAQGVLEAKGEGFVLVERFTPYEQKPRVGLMIAVDLEQYHYGKESRSLIRPTEGTIVERLPPRMQIRRGAPLELPHIMLLVDDPKRSLIEPLYERRATMPKLYDFELMLGSGRIRGWQVKDAALLDRFALALDHLADPAAFKSAYGTEDVLLFAVGDGNHSLATAKAIWEETKKEHSRDPQIADHPARWALVELVNIYDEGLPFHPIHRVLFGVDEEKFLGGLSGYLEHHIERTRDKDRAFALADEIETGGAHRVAFHSSLGSGVISFPHPRAKLAAGSIQEYLDSFLKANPKVGIDFIHGRESLEALAMKPGNLGLYLPPIDKSSFFGTVIRDGVMPRKTFSMGEAPEKRFYVEARRITR
ncbi:MAG TPA: DUF1015 domain-containing protein [Rectinemataceae bacterium]|nr:DUF1015 domain-containing protein [Rectinemataceae bacterium]